MKYQIAEMQIVESGFYKNLDTTAIAKVSRSKCPHNHVVKAVNKVRAHYAATLAAGEISLTQVADQFHAAVVFEVSRGG